MGIKLAVPGRPPSKSNSYRIVRIGGFSKLVPTQAIRDYEQLVAWQCQQLLVGFAVEPPLYPRDIDMDVAIIWHRADRRRSDLDNIAKAINDGLTKGGIWADDAQIVHLSLTAQFDVKGVANEWIEIFITPTINGSCTSAVGAAPPASARGTSRTKSGSTRRSTAKSVAAAPTIVTEPTGS